MLPHGLIHQPTSDPPWAFTPHHSHNPELPSSAARSPSDGPPMTKGAHLLPTLVPIEITKSTCMYIYVCPHKTRTSAVKCSIWGSSASPFGHRRLRLSSTSRLFTFLEVVFCRFTRCGRRDSLPVAGDAAFYPPQMDSLFSFLVLKLRRTNCDFSSFFLVSSTIFAQNYELSVTHCAICRAMVRIWLLWFWFLKKWLP